MLVVQRATGWLVALAAVACTGAQTDVGTGGNVASVSVTPSTTTVSLGSQIPLQAVVQDASGKPITGTDVFWSVRDPNIATVSNVGVVTGLALGSTQVAASSNGKSGIAAITVQKTPVASVVVTPPHVDGVPGGKAQLMAVAYDAGQNPLSGRAITWSTSNAAVAVVDTTGLMTAVGQGSASITATSEGKSGVATVTVSQSAVATVTVSPTPLSMSVGQTTQLTAVLKDAQGNALNGRVVTWSSANTAIATVSAQGLVTAVTAGNTTMTATSETKTGTAAVTVSNVAVGSVVVQPQAPTIMQGTSVQLSATVRDVNGNIVTDRVVTWSSSNVAVATVSTSGVVTGAGVGQVTITATSEGRAGTTSVTVTPDPVASITIQPPSPDTVFIGHELTLTAVTKDSAGTVLTGRAIAWHSNNTTIVTVDANGVVSGLTAGSTAITATSEGKTASVTIVCIRAAVGSVVVSPASDSVTSAGKQFTATVKDVTGTVVTDRTVMWVITQGAVAGVSPTNGATVTVSAKGKGGQATTLIATSETKADTAAIKTVDAVTSILISPVSPSLSVAGATTVQLTALCNGLGLCSTVVPGRTIKWTSSNPAIAVVDANGLVTPKAPGTAQITATATFDGVVSVIPAVIAVTP